MENIILIALLCVYTFLVTVIGYVLASVICFPVAMFFIGERQKKPYIVAIVAAFVIYFIFKNIFNISLPAGLLPF